MKYDLSRFTTAHQRDYQQALAEIRNRIEEKYDFKVSNLYIAQAKTAMGIKERENYNLPKSENNRQPVCPPEKNEGYSGTPCTHEPVSVQDASEKE